MYLGEAARHVASATVTGRFQGNGSDREETESFLPTWYAMDTDRDHKRQAATETSLVWHLTD